MAREKRRPQSVEYFGLRRKILASMTSESWVATPHAGGCYEPDVTEFWDAYQALRNTDPKWSGITANTLLLYVIVQGIIACPAINGYVYFSRKSTCGRVERYSGIDVNMPMLLPGGGMMPMNLHGCESKSLRQLADMVGDLRRRIEHTHFDDPLYAAAFDYCMAILRRGGVYTTLRRICGDIAGRCRRRPLRSQARRAYLAVPEEDRITKRDIEPGTILVTNFGSLYRGAYAPPAMLDIVPPQICAVGIGALTQRPGAAPGGGIALRKYIPFSVIFDHRAIDYGDTVPFMRRLDEIFAQPEALATWL
jgi:pyruvate dehydrogenase E2 component (dihydrolipoamide acetyltransferase)